AVTRGVVAVGIAGGVVVRAVVVGRVEHGVQRLAEPARFRLRRRRGQDAQRGHTQHRRQQQRTHGKPPLVSARRKEGAPAPRLNAFLPANLIYVQPLHGGAGPFRRPRPASPPRRPRFSPSERPSCTASFDLPFSSPSWPWRRRPLPPTPSSSRTATAS